MPFILAFFLACCASCAYRPVGDINTATQQVQNRLFDPKERVEIKLISGTCLIKAGPADAIHVRVAHRYGPAEKFAAQFVEIGAMLKLQEEFFTLARGQTEWTVEVPPATTLAISTTVGHVILNGLTGAVAVKTVSGDIKARRTTGKLELQTTTGDIELSACDGSITGRNDTGDIDLKDCRGQIVLQTISGAIKGKNIGGHFSGEAVSGSITLKAFRPAGRGFFNATAGDLLVELAAAPPDDLALQTVSGDAILRYKGVPIAGHFAFYAAERGEIGAPFPFDHSEAVDLDGQAHQLRSFTRGGDQPQILIRTATGRAALEP